VHPSVWTGTARPSGWRTPDVSSRLSLTLESPFGMHHTEPNLECPVGKGIRPALGQVYGKIEQALRHELESVSVADVLRETLQVR
jgi:hypothetical protein